MKHPRRTTRELHPARSCPRPDTGRPDTGRGGGEPPRAPLRPPDRDLPGHGQHHRRRDLPAARLGGALRHDQPGRLRCAHRRCDRPRPRLRPPLAAAPADRRPVRLRPRRVRRLRRPSSRPGATGSPPGSRTRPSPWRPSATSACSSRPWGAQGGDVPGRPRRAVAPGARQPGRHPLRRHRPTGRHRTEVRPAAAGRGGRAVLLRPGEPRPLPGHRPEPRRRGLRRRGDPALQLPRRGVGRRQRGRGPRPGPQRRPGHDPGHRRPRPPSTCWAPSPSSAWSPTRSWSPPRPPSPTPSTGCSGAPGAAPSSPARP